MKTQFFQFVTEKSFTFSRRLGNRCPSTSFVIPFDYQHRITFTVHLSFGPRWIDYFEGNILIIAGWRFITRSNRPSHSVVSKSDAEMKARAQKNKNRQKRTIKHF